MSVTSKKFVFAYAFLVVLPLLGLAGIVKSGRGLQAPASIDGLWSLQLDSSQLDSLPCGKVLAAIPDQAIVISQSGNSFALSFPGAPKITASGTLDGTALRASLNDMGASKDSACADGQPFTMLATLDRRADSRTLAGKFSPTNCPTCTSVAFHAQRQAAASPKGGH